jgi:SpoIIAA-like
VIELIEGLPEQVVGLEAVGNVTAEDYGVVAAAVERVLTTHEQVRLLHIVGDRFAGHSASALLEDARLGLSNVRSIERIAVVTDLRHLRALVKGAGWSLPGELKLFSTGKRAEAEAWIREGLETESPGSPE